MPHLDPDLVNLLRAVAAAIPILLGTSGLVRIGRRLWRRARKWWTRPVEPGE
jgi:hypothetical protein